MPPPDSYVIQSFFHCLPKLEKHGLIAKPFQIFYSFNSAKFNLVIDMLF